MGTKEIKLYAIWGSLFIFSAAFGFFPNPTGLGKALMVLLSLGFFIPPAILLYRGIQAGDRRAVCRVRDLAALSLSATLVLLVGNFLSVLAPQIVGDILYWLLIVVSAPMVCGQYWAVSLFLWACLLFGAITRMPKKKE